MQAAQAETMAPRQNAELLILSGTLQLTLARRAFFMSSGIVLCLFWSLADVGNAAEVVAATSGLALSGWREVASFAIDAASLDPSFSFGAFSAWFGRVITLGASFGATSGAVSV